MGPPCSLLETESEPSNFSRLEKIPNWRKVYDYARQLLNTLYYNRFGVSDGAGAVVSRTIS